MGEKPILYSYYHSSCSWRVRIALAVKGIDYEYRSIEKEKEDEFNLKVNPMGQVPALVINGKTFAQSVSILEYLDEIYPHNPLMPQNPLDRAKVREIVEMINSGIQPFSNLGAAMKHSDNEVEQINWIHYWIIKGFTALETILSECAGIYCLQNELTMADIFLIPQVESAARWKVEMKQFPIISKIHLSLSKMEPFKKAHFSQQPDCPPELRTGI